MNEKCLKYLADIEKSIVLIEAFLGEKRIFQEYSENLMLKSAVERQLEIIGEAINSVLKIEPNLVISHARNIVNMRNKLIHDYDSVNDDVVWLVIVKHLPILKAEVSEILNQ